MNRYLSMVALGVAHGLILMALAAFLNSSFFVVWAGYAFGVFATAYRWGQQ